MDYSSISAEELATVCFRTGDELAWAEFVRRFQPLIAGVASRVARQWGDVSPQVVDELVQETYLKLCAERARILEKFVPTHKDAMYGYIKVFTANLVHDHFKASRSEKRGGSVVASSIEADGGTPVAHSSRSSARLMEQRILIQEVDACLREMSGPNSSERDRTIFWLYYRVGLAASAIAALPTIGLSTKGVESILLRLTRQVRERLGVRQGRAASRDEGIQQADSL